MRSDDGIQWKRNAIAKYLLAFAVFVGFAIFFAIAFINPHGRGIGFQLLVFAGYPVYLLIILLGLRSDKYLPRKYGISREKLCLQYINRTETYPWAQISRIYPERSQGGTKLVIESVDGQVFQIPFLLKDEREKIIGYHENLKKLSKPA